MHQSEGRARVFERVHDKRGGAATRIGTREALRCGDASGDATGARVTRNSILKVKCLTRL